MNYDAWKTRSPDDEYPNYDEPAEECLHEEREIDWEGRATCLQCGHSWWASRAEIKADAATAGDYERFVRREMRLDKWRQVRAWFRNLIPKRRKSVEIDDELPF